MNIEMIKELQGSFATESLGENFETETVDKYRQNPLGDIFHELDAIEENGYAMESLGETIRGSLCFFQDLEVARESEVDPSAAFSVESIIEEKIADYRETFNGNALEESFATESLVNKAKRAGYNMKIHGKEFVNKLLTWIKAIYDNYTVSEGKFKSYKKLLKKYREKLNMSTPSTKEDKEIKIRKTDYAKVIKEYFDAVPSSMSGEVTRVKSATTQSDLVDKLILGVGFMLTSKVPNKIVEGIPSGDLADKSAEALQEVVKEKKFVENFKGYLEDIKDSGEAEDMSPATAQSELATKSSAVEALLVDRKYKKSLDSYIKAVNDTLAKLNKKKDIDVSEGSVEASQKVAAIGALVTQYRTSVLGPWTKFAKSSIQALLADMAKVINYNTTIKGN